MFDYRGVESRFVPMRKIGKTENFSAVALEGKWMANTAF
jgi:hypothetical protein